jgi:hypothetical protein
VLGLVVFAIHRVCFIQHRETDWVTGKAIYVGMLTQSSDNPGERNLVSNAYRVPAWIEGFHHRPKFSHDFGDNLNNRGYWVVGIDFI